MPATNPPTMAPKINPIRTKPPERVAVFVQHQRQDQPRGGADHQSDHDPDERLSPEPFHGARG